jgi:hypothetical protein
LRHWEPRPRAKRFQAEYLPERRSIMDHLQIHTHEVEAWAWIAGLSLFGVVALAILAVVSGHDWQVASNDIVLPLVR